MSSSMLWTSSFAFAVETGVGGGTVIRLSRLEMPVSVMHRRSGSLDRHPGAENVAVILENGRRAMSGAEKKKDAVSARVSLKFSLGSTQRHALMGFPMLLANF